MASNKSPGTDGLPAEFLLGLLGLRKALFAKRPQL